MTSGFLRQKEERSRPKANTGMSAMETRAREYLKQKAGESRPKATKVHSGGSTIEARAYLKQKAGETREIGREYGVVPQTTSGPGLPGPYAQRAGIAGSTALPYAAAVQERVKPAVPEIKYKRGGPGPIREEAKSQLSAEEMDRIEAGQLAAWNNHNLEAGYSALISDLAQLREGGATPAEINSVLINAVSRGIISRAQKTQLQGAYVGSGR